jgi:hypothetical protein
MNVETLNDTYINALDFTPKVLGDAEFTGKQ